MAEDLEQRLLEWLGDVHSLRLRLTPESRSEMRFYPDSIAPELLSRSYEMLGEVIEQIHLALEALATSRARSEALEKALQWYADKANWETPFHPSGYGTLASNVTNDLGRRASAALSRQEEGTAK